MKSRAFIVLTGCLVVQAWYQPTQVLAAAPGQPEYVPGLFDATHNGTGQVKAVIKDTVMINQEPVTALNWPAMTMTYEVRNPAIVAGLQPGKQIKFSFRREGFSYVLTEISQ